VPSGALRALRLYLPATTRTKVLLLLIFGSIKVEGIVTSESDSPQLLIKYFDACPPNEKLLRVTMGAWIFSLMSGGMDLDSGSGMVQPLRVLLVEDEVELLDLFARRLSRAGFEVVSASSAEDAIAQLQERVFDVVVSDIQLPGMSGFDVFERVRSLERKPAFFFVTGHGEGTPEMNRALSLGADGVYSKPVSLKVLIERLTALGANRPSI
jgi:CheY-like chemotaxis protein